MHSSQVLETEHWKTWDWILHFCTGKNLEVPFVCGVQMQIYSDSLVNTPFSPDQSGKPWCLPSQCTFHLWHRDQMPTNPLILKTGTMFTLVVKPSLNPFLSILLHCLFSLTFKAALSLCCSLWFPPVNPSVSSCPFLPCHDKVIALTTFPWVSDLRTARCRWKLCKQLTVLKWGKRWHFSCSCSRSTSGLVSD